MSCSRSDRWLQAFSTLSESCGIALLLCLTFQIDCHPPIRSIFRPPRSRVPAHIVSGAFPIAAHAEGARLPARSNLLRHRLVKVRCGDASIPHFWQN
jgi:hypothetical protein